MGDVMMLETAIANRTTIGIRCSETLLKLTPEGFSNSLPRKLWSLTA